MQDYLAFSDHWYLFFLFIVQQRAIKTLETRLKVGSEVYLRLYERAMENLAEQRTQFIAVHSALRDYRNGVLYDSSSAESEKHNVARCHRHFSAQHLRDSVQTSTTEKDYAQKISKNLFTRRFTRQYHPEANESECRANYTHQRSILSDFTEVLIRRIGYEPLEAFTPHVNHIRDDR